jgi:hypothetical protein
MKFEDQIESLAPILSRLKKNDLAEPFYELMSDAFIWDDESVINLNPEQLGCLRAIFRFRTSMIVQESDPRFETLWKCLKQACPKWIGFSPDRCCPNEKLAEKYRADKRKSLRTVSKLMKLNP